MSRRKHELQTNELIEYGSELREFIVRNALVLVLIAGVLVSGGVIAYLIASQRQEKAARTWENYLTARGNRRGADASERFATEAPDNPLAQIALGDAKLNSLLSRRDEYSDPAKATELLNSAQAAFDKAEQAADSDDRFARAQAWLGLGAVAESRAGVEPAKWKEHLDKARDLYAKVLRKGTKDEFNDGPAIEARRRLKAMEDFPTTVKVSQPELVLAKNPLSLRSAKLRADREAEEKKEMEKRLEEIKKAQEKAAAEAKKKADEKAAEDKKKADEKKTEVKKDEPKKTEVKKDEPKKDETKKTEKASSK